MTKGEHTYERTYVRDKPYIPSTTLLCEGIKIAHSGFIVRVCFVSLLLFSIYALKVIP